VLTQQVNSRVVHTDEMLFLAECIPISELSLDYLPLAKYGWEPDYSELGCEKIALNSFLYIAHKTLMMY